MMDDFAKGLFTAMSEFGQPFISESIWTEAALDIIARGGRTREGLKCTVIKIQLEIVTVKYLHT